MRTVVFVLLWALAAFPAAGQNPQSLSRVSSDSDATMQDMDRMDMSHGHMEMKANSLVDLTLQHSTAGTDGEPNSTNSEMLMTSKGNWTFMFHGVAFLAGTQQTGPRGRDKLFAPNWVMPMAQRKLDNGTLTLRAMLSFEPGTVSQRRYPLLFQQGETAFGRPIVDGQHPHDFFMELAALYDYKVNEKTLLSFYFAPMGDPALGPIAYPHRASASENPIAVVGHHLEDSTHIADDVLTVGITHHGFRLEASGFHGREPDEFRWDLDSGKIDSWSTRLTMNPAQNWSMQYSIGQLHSPEELAPNEDVRRMTASLMYNLPFHDGNWASTMLWGRNQSLEDGNIGNAYLAESTVRFLKKNFAWIRIENVDRTNELLLGERLFPRGFQERYFTRVQAYTAGFDREIGNFSHLATAIGGQMTWYGVPAALKSIYGEHPLGLTVFMRIRAR
ncbi:MAG TPA: hypothetical protein VJ453_06130 [Terriglobales bacterium]|nr:hypothetical protein [Terriglobales bacterium]